MGQTAKTFQWASLPALALVAAAGLLHWHLAVAVIAGCVIGAIFSIARSYVLTAILLCPVILLAFVVSTVSWHWPLFGIRPIFGDANLALPLGFFVGGGAVCSLLPYAVARWSRHTLLVSLMAWASGLAFTICVAVWAAPLIDGSSNHRINREFVNKQRAMNYSLWLTYSGLIDSVLYFDYAGNVDIPDCIGIHSHAYTMHISADARKDVEQYTSRPLTEDLQRWFSKSSDGLEIPCTTSIKTNADNSINVEETCVPTESLRSHAQKKHFERFNIRLPTIHLLAPLLAPHKSSKLTITAPRGCVASTFPIADSITHENGRERIVLSAGFPRDGLLPMEFKRLVAEPWIVHVDLMAPSLQGTILASATQSLNDYFGLFILFAATAMLVRLVLRLAFDLMLKATWGQGVVSAGQSILLRLSESVQASRTWYRSEGRFVRWSISGALVLVAALLILGFLAEPILVGLVYFFLDPSYHLAGYLFVFAFCIIEIIAFVVRRFSPYRSP